ncbi:MAG: hypothetical protein AAGI34_04335, partial [Pseudomonadota bacterium]
MREAMLELRAQKSTKLGRGCLAGIRRKTLGWCSSANTPQCAAQATVSSPPVSLDGRGHMIGTGHRPNPGIRSEVVPR